MNPIQYTTEPISVVYSFHPPQNMFRAGENRAFGKRSLKRVKGIILTIVSPPPINYHLRKKNPRNPRLKVDKWDYTMI